MQIYRRNNNVKFAAGRSNISHNNRRPEFQKPRMLEIAASRVNIPLSLLVCLFTNSSRSYLCNPLLITFGVHFFPSFTTRMT
jgi:hypothetical protein